MENKKIWIAVGGVGALIAGALALHYFNSGDSGSTAKFPDLIKDLNNFGTVKFDPSGALQIDDFVRLFTIVTKTAKQAVKGLKQENTGPRREALKVKNEEEYKKIVMAQIRCEEEIY
jgi:hypothetical protein